MVKTKYKLPESIASMTIHHMYGLSEVEDVPLEQYMKDHKYAFLADLSAQRYKPDQIEEAVNSGKLKAVSWPKKKRLTDMIYEDSAEAKSELESLAKEAVKNCYGMKSDEPIGGDFASVGAEMGSQQRALVGLIYARELGDLIEVEKFDRGAGPLYVNKDSPLAIIFGQE